MKKQINVEGIMLYGYHGCLEEESRIGQEFRVDVYFIYDFEKSAISDRLEETIDYCVVFEIVKKQIQIRANLIENVAHRIKTELAGAFPQAESISVKVTKFNPPMNGNVEKVSVVI
ncbi:MAG: dihydroneopterin aldolase [Bacteroidota bacterium]|jgi:dihydroneopterin aldolase